MHIYDNNKKTNIYTHERDDVRAYAFHIYILLERVYEVRVNKQDAIWCTDVYICGERAIAPFFPLFGCTQTIHNFST